MHSSNKGKPLRSICRPSSVLSWKKVITIVTVYLLSYKLRIVRRIVPVFFISIFKNKSSHSFSSSDYIQLQQIKCFYFSLCEREKGKEEKRGRHRCRHLWSLKSPAAVETNHRATARLIYNATGSCGVQQPQEPPYPPSHPFSVRLNISSSDVASFFGLHLSFQSHFPRLSSSPLPFFFFSPALHNSLAIHKGVLCIIVVFILLKSRWISRNKVFRGGLMFLSFVFLSPLQLPGRKNKKTDISITTGPPSFMDSHTYTVTQVLHSCLVSQCFWTNIQMTHTGAYT